MASCLDVLVYFGFDTFETHQPGDYELHHYLISYLPEKVDGYGSGQHLSLISGEEIRRDLPGSGQAGTLRIYGGLIRRASPDAMKTWLKAAPWGNRSALVAFDDEMQMELTIFTLPERS